MRRILFLISIFTIIGLGLLLYKLRPEEELNRQAKVEQKLEIWAYSAALLDKAKEYQKDHPEIEVVTKRVENADTLLEELYIANSAGTPPHVAEVPSYYGLSPLVKSGSVLQVDDVIPSEIKASLVESIEKRFTYEGKLWAIPIGYEVPLLYVNSNFTDGQSTTIEKKSIEELISIGKQIELQHEGIWGIHSDPLYPWYITNLLQNEGIGLTQFNESSWVKMKQEGLIPPYTYHLAITQFVNGEGGILISTSKNIQLFEKLIGTKFKWQTLPFPINEKNLIPSGNGLVLFNHPESESLTKNFITFLLQKEQLQALAVKETLIPAYRNVTQDPTFIDYYRQYPGYQQAIYSSLQAGGLIPLIDDEEQWERIVELDQNIMEDR
ncbi:ABC transporter substrate-binding protein [Fredinandcohnia sp. 179-A 10B2 NHS]|uniref:ABC transporter substrate-binding protein n=1 Tax=Fredinandcohnia sp. 179-A 10B2 NHS TaxID=3235176 RepID=UPI0039A29C11